MKKENFYIDLSKCTEEHRKDIAKILSDNNQPCYLGLLNCLNNGDYNKTFYLLSFFKRRGLWDFAHEGLESTENKTELTYPEFIKLFESGVENNGWIKIEKSEDLPRQRNEYWFVSKLEKDKIVKAYFNPYSALDGNKAHYVKLYSHYQPIVKPEPPKY